MSLNTNIGPADLQRIAWVKSFKSGSHWFLKLQARYGEKLGTQKYYAMALEDFSKYVEMNPDEIVEAFKERLKEDVNEAVAEWNDKLELFVPWLEKNRHLKRSVAVTRFAAIKSFFKANAAIKLTVVTPESYSESLKPVTIEELREKILTFADVYQTFEILLLKDSGLSQEDALRLNVGDIEELSNGFGYIEAFRGKKHVDYETFIGPNATDAMKKVLDYRKRLGCEITAESPLFVKKNKPTQRQTWGLIASSLRRLGEKAGVELSTHRLRKTFETYMAIGKVHPLILKYWMGHKVKRGKSDIEARYIIPPKPEQVKLYMEAYQHIDVSPKIVQDEKQMRIKAILDNARMLGKSEDEIAHIKTLIARRKVTKPEDVIEMLKENKAEDPNDCPNGHNCPEFKKIPEAELLAHLNQGWQIVHNLQNGRVIVRK